MLIEYIKQMSPISSGMEDRITIVNGTAVCVKWLTNAVTNPCTAGSPRLPPTSLAVWLLSFFALLVIRKL